MGCNNLEARNISRLNHFILTLLIVCVCVTKQTIYSQVMQEKIQYMFVSVFIINDTSTDFTTVRDFIANCENQG